MASLHDRLRAAAGVPERPRTTPDRLRAMVRRRRRRRRAAAVAVSMVVVAVLGTGAALLVRSQTQRLEFTDAPSPTRDRSSTEPRASETPGDEDPGVSANISRGTRDRRASESPDPSTPPESEGSDPSATQACTDGPDGFQVSDDAYVRGIGDVDGDDLPDGLWIDPSRTLGIATAAGGIATFAVESAAPSSVSALAVDADRQPPLELLVSDGRTVQLLVFDDCEIVPVTKTPSLIESPAAPRDGQPWVFDLGFRGTGTGVGCLELFDGVWQLAGFNVVRRSDDTVEYAQTVLDLDGRTASVGEMLEGTYERRFDSEAIERLSEVTCGDVTMADGVTTPTP